MRRLSSGGTAVAVVLLLAAVAALVAAFTGMKRATVSDSTGLSLFGSAIEVAALVAEGVHSSNQLLDGAQEAYGMMKNSTKTWQEKEARIEDHMKVKEVAMQKLQTMTPERKAELKQQLMRKFNITSLKDLRPQMHKHNGTACYDDEEMYLQLCYKKCSLLTAGGYPHRVSAWTCCQSEPCGPYNQRTQMELCGGFDVSGDAMGNGCPHAPGACLQDEEMALGTCYKRCSLLTYGKLPYRLAASTCCTSQPKLKALLDLPDLVAKCATDQAYATGGGAGDNNKATPADAHLPLQSLTEV